MITVLEIDLSYRKNIYRFSKTFINIIRFILYLLIICSFSIMLYNYQFSREFNGVPFEYQELLKVTVKFIYFLLGLSYFRMANNTVNRVTSPNIIFIGFYKYKNRIKKVYANDLIIDNSNYIFIKYSNNNKENIEDTVIVPLHNVVKIYTKARSKFTK